MGRSQKARPGFHNKLQPRNYAIFNEKKTISTGFFTFHECVMREVL